MRQRDPRGSGASVRMTALPSRRPSLSGSPAAGGAARIPRLGAPERGDARSVAIVARQSFAPQQPKVCACTRPRSRSPAAPCRSPTAAAPEALPLARRCRHGCPAHRGYRLGMLTGSTSGTVIGPAGWPATPLGAPSPSPSAASVRRSRLCLSTVTVEEALRRFRSGHPSISAKLRVWLLNIGSLNSAFPRREISASGTHVPKQRAHCLGAIPPAPPPAGAREGRKVAGLQRTANGPSRRGPSQVT